LTALHVSSDIIAHHQEHINRSYSFWFYSRVCCCQLLSWISHDSSRQRHRWV